jgi:uridine phosphorylase
VKKTNSDKDIKTLVRPMRMEGEPLLGPDAIMIPIPSELKSMVDFSQAERTSLITLSPFKLFTIKRDKDSSLALAGPFLGAPQAVIVMEKLIALGAKRIWVLGWCGSLQRHLQIGDLIIPTTALSEEGTSAHYPVEKDISETSVFLNKALEGALSKADLPFKKGPVWTTDAIYRETERKVLAYGKKGYLAVEMEMSALIRLAAYRSVELAGLLVVSDELFTLKWHSAFKTDRLKKRSKAAGHLILDLCMNGIPETLVRNNKETTR